MSNVKNQAAASRLLDESAVEQRALQIARLEGRDLATEDDRARAREELLAPNQTTGDPEVAPELGAAKVTAWDEAPGDNGAQVPVAGPDDEQTIMEDLTEHGLRGPGSDLRL
jgi:hypothetical protein